MRVLKLRRPRPGRVLQVAGALGLAALAALMAGCGSGSTGAAGSSAAAVPSGSASGGSAASGSAASGSAASGSGSGATGGTLVLYSGRNQDLIGPLLEQFTAETGVQVEFRGGDSGELAAQILTEGDASPADVFFSQDAGALGAVTQAGLFAALPATTLDRVPAAYAADDGTWAGVSGRARVVVYNPTLAPTPPDTVDGLLDPQWKGQIGYAPTNASWQSFVTGLRVLRGEDGARQWLTAFAAQEPRAYERNGAVRDAVNSGEIALGLVNHYYLYEKIAADGAAAVTAQNRFMAPGDPGGLLNVAGVGVLTTAPNAEQAQVFVDYLLSDAGQEYFAAKTKEYPLVPGIAAAAEVPPLADLSPPQIDLSDLASLEQTQQLLSEVGLLTR
ncbi:iron ABC transporter substrate-binding protein [Nakamurella sp.]|uniref:iron ABC transporter substrate-binding protein n=1 Tax=Nakamurella sp. TaxID=1869182 RepID=UPI003B3A826A